jgi:hypothetical protein
MWGCVLDSSGLEQGPRACSCEHQWPCCWNRNRTAHAQTARHKENTALVLLAACVSRALSSNGFESHNMMYRLNSRRICSSIGSGSVGSICVTDNGTTDNANWDESVGMIISLQFSAYCNEHNSNLHCCFFKTFWSQSVLLCLTVTIFRLPSFLSFKSLPLFI